MLVIGGCVGAGWSKPGIRRDARAAADGAGERLLVVFVESAVDLAVGKNGPLAAVVPAMAGTGEIAEVVVLLAVGEDERDVALLPSSEFAGVVAHEMASMC